MGKRFAALIIAGTLAIAGLAGCDTSSNNPPAPTSFIVNYGGTAYCGYVYSPYEIDMYRSANYFIPTCTPIQFPSISIVPPAGTLAAALAGYWTTYSPFWGSGYWYDTYYSPIGSRYHVSVISRTTFNSNVTIFTHTYSSQIKTNTAKAKWTGGKTGNYSFPSSNIKKTSVNNSKYNSNVGTTNSKSNNTSSVNRYSTNSRSTGGSVGKSGTSGSVGGLSGGIRSGRR